MRGGISYKMDFLPAAFPRFPRMRVMRFPGRERVSPTEQYIADATRILALLDVPAIDRVLDHLVRLRERGGRLFVLGVGGSAANASHAVNDFRKIAQIEAYSPTDNVSELTAWTNDAGWDSVFVNWLRGSRLTSNDVVFGP
jgi:D-sedoheptulose 7-phosphate isomerase